MAHGTVTKLSQKPKYYTDFYTQFVIAFTIEIIPIHYRTPRTAITRTELSAAKQLATISRGSSVQRQNPSKTNYSVVVAVTCTVITTGTAVRHSR